MLARLLRRYVRYAPPWCPTAAAAYRLDRHLRDHPITTITRTRHGSRIPVTTSDIIQRYLYLFGVWEPHITGWLQSRLQPGDTFIDVGANIGYYSLLAARCVGPTGHVVAIEASPHFADTLATTAVANGHHNIRVINRAVSADHGNLTFYLEDSGNLGGTTSVRPRHAAPAFTTRAAPLADLLTERELTTARIIKIDVEGAEADVIASLTPHLHRLHCDSELLVEVTPRLLAKQQRSPDEITQPLAVAGFRAYRMANDYTAGSYTNRTLTPPRPHSSPIREMSDILFSRAEQD